MVVLSKLAGVSLPYNCYEVGHSWHPECNTAALALGASAFYEGLKIYLPLYVVSLLLKGNISLNKCLNVLTNIITSSAFLGFHGVGVILISCFLRKHLGGFYFLSYFFIPTLITSFLALMIERNNRRLPLAIYVANVATETALRMAASRGVVKPVPNAEVYLFSVLMAINLYIAKKHGYSTDVISSIFKFILGENEAKQSAEKKNLLAPRRYFILEKVVLCGLSDRKETSLFEKIWYTIKHSSCPHNTSCIVYWLQGFFRPFLLGYAVSSASTCFSLGTKIFSHPYLLLSLLLGKKNRRLGLFLGGFSATFRLVNCLLRWFFAKDQSLQAIPAALLGGLFMKLFPSSTISLYLMWKTMERGYLLGMDKGVLPHLSAFTPFLYSLSTALLFHVAVMEAHNLKPAYVKFLSKVTHNRLNRVNHYALDAFGTQSSKMFPGFYPDLDYQHTSRVYQKNMLIH